MLKIQDKFLAYLNQIKGELAKAQSVLSGGREGADEVNGSVASAESGGADEIQRVERRKQEITEAELIVPVVGGFSAGKSTLINSFLEKGELLSVNVTPETALATELRYAEDERVEAVKDNDEVDRFSIAELSSLKAKAAQYRYAKVFINSEQLREIRPLVLVDMPGFDSPHDLHQKAISTYLARGSHYAVLISVEEGTVTRSIYRQLAEFYDHGKTFSVFLSKANLRSPDEVEDIAENIQGELDDSFSFDDPVETVGEEGGESLSKMLKTIEPEDLFAKLWRPKLDTDSAKLNDRFNTWIHSLQKDAQENKTAIADLAESQQDLQRKREQMIQNIRTRYSTPRVNTIVEQVGADLNQAVDELTEVALSGGEDGLQRRLEETVRVSATAHVKAEIEQLNARIAEDLSNSLEGVKPILASYTDATDWDLNTKFDTALDKLADEPKDSGNLSTMGAVGLSATALAVPLVGPIMAVLVGVASVFLRRIFGGSSNGEKEREQQKQQIRSQLIGTAIPSVKDALREKLADDLARQVNELIDKQAAAIDALLQTQQNDIAEGEQAKQQAKLHNVEQTISELTTIRDAIRSLADREIAEQ